MDCFRSPKREECSWWSVALVDGRAGKQEGPQSVSSIGIKYMESPRCNDGWVRFRAKDRLMFPACLQTLREG